jgi:hypothetical protein
MDLGSIPTTVHPFVACGTYKNLASFMALILLPTVTDFWSPAYFIGLFQPLHLSSVLCCLAD